MRVLFVVTLFAIIIVTIITGAAAVTINPLGKDSTLKSSDATPDPTQQFGPVKRIPLEPNECAALVVMLHGLGDTGEGWLETMANFQRPRANLCVLLPTARKMFVKVAKQQVNAWFDVSDARFKDLKQNVDVENVKKSAEYVLRLTRQQMREFEIPWKRVIFAGFSQGGALALYCALTAPETSAGAVVVGGFLAAQSHLLGLGLMRLLRAETPVLFIHGVKDTVVPLAHAQHARDALKKVGFKKLVFKEYAELTHGMDDESFEDFQAFIDEKLGGGGAGAEADL